jgi:apolipoprotein N-acyltransferase
MRSLENQRYSIRSTNNGISAIVNPFGEIEEHINFNKKGVISRKIYARNGHTPISKYGYNTLFIFIFSIFLYSALYFNIKTFKR